MTHKDRIVLVTGASRGIGYAAAKAFAAEGAHVIALARTVGGLESLDDEIKAIGGKVTLIPVDVTDTEALSRLPAVLMDRFRRLDALILNAGILGNLTPVTDIQDKDWSAVFTTNVTSNVALLQGMDTLLRASDAPRVVGISSGRARNFAAFWGPYSASKAAFEALLLTYALEVEETGIKVNIVDPAATRTAMREKAMPGEDPLTLKEPDALAPMILSYASQDCTVTGIRHRYGE